MQDHIQTLPIYLSKTISVEKNDSLSDTSGIDDRKSQSEKSP